jgi:hypothetical protein
MRTTPVCSEAISNDARGDFIIWCGCTTQRERLHSAHAAQVRVELLPVARTLPGWRRVGCACGGCLLEPAAQLRVVAHQHIAQAVLLRLALENQVRHAQVRLAVW